MQFVTDDNENEVDMDHRRSSRIDVSRDVRLADENGPLGSFKTRNISRDGLFLETGSINLPANRLLRLQLDTDGATHRVSAIVIHRNAEGIGLMLAATDPGYSRLILQILADRAQQLPDGVGAPLCAAMGHGQHAGARAAVSEDALRWAGDSATLVLRLGERFDISACMTIQVVIEAVRVLSAQRVVIDFCATEKVFDTGMALLLLLRNSLRKLETRIYFANCAPKVYDRLFRAGLTSGLRMPAANADRISTESIAGHLSERSQAPKRHNGVHSTRARSAGEVGLDDILYQAQADESRAQVEE